MQMREDPDLEFLGECTSKELDPLVQVLTHGRDGTRRLTSSIDLTAEFKRHFPQHRKYWRLPAAELQYKGAHTAMTWVRGNRGVLYRTTLTDVCDRMGVNYKSDSEIELIETNLLMKLGLDIFGEMTPDEMKAFADELGVKPPPGLRGWTATTLVRVILERGGFETYKLALKLANAVARKILGRGLSLAANKTLTKSLSRLIACSRGLEVVWAANIVMGPAYRVTVPAVLQVIALRRLVSDRLERAA